VTTVNKITIDHATQTKFVGVGSSAEVYDESGHVLGYFTPVVDSSLYRSVEPPFSESELNRREAESGGRTLAVWRFRDPDDMAPGI